MNGVLKSRVLLFVVVAGGGCLLDLVTKWWMFAHLGPPGGATQWVWEPYFGFQTSLNEGALFGIGQGQVWLFAALSFVFGFGIIYWLFVRGAARDGLLTLSMACIMAGVLGNLYDRLGLWWSSEFAGHPRYAVRDFILWQYGEWVWPNFNLADAMLVCGAALLMYQAWTTPLEQPTPATTAP